MLFRSRPLFSMMKDICTPPAAAVQLVSKTDARTTNNADSTTTTIKFASWNGNTYNSNVAITRFAPNADGKKAADKTVDKTTVYVSSGNFWKLVGIVSILVLFVTMVYGPIAAFLVEMFPIRIRYTSMSLPYHVGNGVFGGLVPFIATILAATSKANGDPQLYLAGLNYPIAVATMTLIIGLLFLKNTTKAVED